MNKERFNIIANSLSSYFGCGFNTIDEQLDIDLGLIAKEFDQEAQERMDLGNCMEEGCLNFFEKIIIIGTGINIISVSLMFMLER